MPGRTRARDAAEEMARSRRFSASAMGCSSHDAEESLVELGLGAAA
jgi:hypothetical protein